MRAADLHLAGDAIGHGVAGGRGERDRERAAAAGARRDGDRAAVCLDDAPDQGEAEAVAMDLPLEGVGTAEERLEDVRQIRRRDAGAVVADGDPHLRLAPLADVLRADTDPPI